MQSCAGNRELPQLMLDWISFLPGADRETALRQAARKLFKRRTGDTRAGYRQPDIQPGKCPLSFSPLEGGQNLEKVALVLRDVLAIHAEEEKIATGPDGNNCHPVIE